MLYLELVTLDGIKFAEEIYSVGMPTELGQITVFEHHMPLVSLVEPGVITIKRNKTDNDDKAENYAVYGGVIEISDKRIRVLVDSADHSDEVSEAEAKEALERAKKLAAEAGDDQTLEQAMSQITLQQSRLKIAELKSKHRTRKKEYKPN